MLEYATFRLISPFGNLPGLVAVENMWGTVFGIMAWAGVIGLARASRTLVRIPLTRKSWRKARAGQVRHGPKRDTGSARTVCRVDSDTKRWRLPRAGLSTLR